jgi:hypothetical protein
VDAHLAKQEERGEDQEKGSDNDGESGGDRAFTKDELTCGHRQIDQRRMMRVSPCPQVRIEIGTEFRRQDTSRAELSAPDTPHRAIEPIV